MDLRDVRKLSCADLEWLKNIENCGKLELPVYAKNNSSTIAISEIMRLHKNFILGYNECKDLSNLTNYVVTSRIAISMRLSDCNSIIISFEHWGNWN